jgi:hypothetical protein
MTRRSRFWARAAVVFAFINLAGGVYAAAMGEPLHAATHFLLLGATAFLWWRLAPQPDELQLAGVQQAMQSIDHLQQSVDAIALEVERIGEAQRFEARLLNERVVKSSNSPSDKKEQ